MGLVGKEDIPVLIISRLVLFLLALVFLRGPVYQTKAYGEDN
jgi:hypothetical protein